MGFPGNTTSTHHRWSPEDDITVVHDVGLFVSIPLLAIALYGFARAEHRRAREIDRYALRRAGEQLREGRVIVAVTRTTDGMLRTPDGTHLRIDDAPLGLAPGVAGDVLGPLVREEGSEEADYREAGRAWVGRLLPLGGRYTVVPPEPPPGTSTAGAIPVAFGYCVAMTTLAGLARSMDPGEGRDILSLFWLMLAGLPFAMLLLLLGLAFWVRRHPEATASEKDRRA